MSTHDPALRARAAELAAQGVAKTRIAAMLGVGRTTVDRWLRPDFAERVRKANRERMARSRAAQEAEVARLRTALEDAEREMSCIAYDLHENGMHPDDAAEHLAKACEQARAAIASSDQQATPDQPGRRASE